MQRVVNSLSDGLLILLSFLPPAYAAPALEQAQYQTRGIVLDVAPMAEWSALSYWEQKIGQFYNLGEDPRLRGRTEERDAVLAALWQIRPKALTAETKIVAIVKSGASQSSADLAYEFAFIPGTKPRAEARFIAEGASAMPVKAASPSSAPANLRYSFTGFPGNDIRAYWEAHPVERDLVFGWIAGTRTRSVDQIVMTSGSLPEAAYHLKAKRNSSGQIESLIIRYLGTNVPMRVELPADYTSHDLADIQIEKAQSAKGDPLGQIRGLDSVPPEERLPVKFALWQYFQKGTRNAEVDAIVPIPGANARALYAFRFKAPNSDVDIERVADDRMLNAVGDLAHVNGFSEHASSALTLKEWLAARYPNLTAKGDTVDEVVAAANAEIEAASGHPEWFTKTYGIEILTGVAAQAALKADYGHSPSQLTGLKDFSPDELKSLESALQTLSDPLRKSLQGIRMVRQAKAISYEQFKTVPSGQPAGLTLLKGPMKTIIIFDASHSNDDALFIGKTKGANRVRSTAVMTYIHEFGHVVAALHDAGARFNELVKTAKIAPVTWYAASNLQSELFPEVFALYHCDPEWLRNSRSTLFNWMNELSRKDLSR